MNTIVTILSVVIATGILLIICVAIYNHFQDYIIRINEANVSIEAVLRKRFDLLNKASSIIKNNAKDEQNIIEMISKLRSKKLTNFELDRNLYDAINEFHVVKERHEELQTNEKFLKIEINLMESESEIVGLRKYYNDIVTDYNKMIKSFPSNIIAFIKRYKVKEYFDGNSLDNQIRTVRL